MTSFSHSHGPAHNPHKVVSAKLEHPWCWDEPRATWTHKTHHGPDLGEATTFPLIVYSVTLHGAHIQMAIFPGTPKWEFRNYFALFTFVLCCLLSLCVVVLHCLFPRYIVIAYSHLGLLLFTPALHCCCSPCVATTCLGLLLLTMCCCCCTIHLCTHFTLPYVVACYCSLYVVFAC